jgi:hypothetical protein
MVWGAIVGAAAGAASNRGSIQDENVGAAAGWEHGVWRGWRKDPRNEVEKLLDPGAFFLKGKPKFREFVPKSLSELINEAKGAFTTEQQREILQSQINTQQGMFPEFFDMRDQTVASGRDLIDRISTGDLERRMTTQEIRGAQAVRGLSLGPAAAIQEGLEVARAQREAEMDALNLGQGLAQFSASTPLGLQQLDFNQLLAQAGQIDLARGGFQTDAQISNINMQRDRDAASMASLGRLLGSIKFGGSKSSGDAKLQGSTIGQPQRIVIEQGQGFSKPTNARSSVTTTSGQGVDAFNSVDYGRDRYGPGTTTLEAYPRQGFQFGSA